MKIIVDGMGGDNAPLQILKGCELAVKQLGAEIIVTGPEEILNKTIEENKIDKTNITVVHAPQIITMDDEPVSVVKAKRDSSMGKALDMLKNGEADAMVSAGNTGALLSGGTLIVKRIKGVKRASLGATLPTKTGYSIIMDSGATIDCRPEYLNQYGLMGSVYMKHMFGLANPTVALANNGTEECKGTELYTQAYQLLRNNPDINFIGNIEGRGVMLGESHVIVADGFTGNLILKSCEGAALYLLGLLKQMLTKNLLSKLAALMLSKNIKQIKSKVDYKEVGGAPLIGTTKPVIKAHGSSDAKAIKNAIRQAMTYASSDIITEITAAIAKTKETDNV